MEKGTFVMVDWDTDGTPIEDLGLPQKVVVPNHIEIDDIADYLSDEYGFCVSSFFIIGTI